MKQAIIILVLIIYSLSAQSQTIKKTEDCADCIFPDELPDRLNSNVKVVSNVIKVQQKFNASGKPTFINFERTDFNVVIFENDLKNFQNLKSLEGKSITVHGFVKLFHPTNNYKEGVDFPQIILNDNTQITIN